MTVTRTVRNRSREGKPMSFASRMKAAAVAIEAAASQPTDPWRLRLERVRGKTGFDGLERISTQSVMDILEIPQRQRSTAAYRHLGGVMAELGWSPIRLRDLNRRGYREQ